MTSVGARWLQAAAVLLFLAACGGGDKASAPASSETCSGASCGTCGDGVLQASRGETCDTAITSGAGACPTTCAPSGDVCAPSVLRGAGTCTAACAPSPITACTPGDGCCPTGCTAAAGDTDCAPGGASLAGAWYTKISTPGKITGAGGSDNVTLNAWIRTQISAAGDLVFDLCKLTVTGGTIKPTYSQALLSTLHATGRLAGGAQVAVGGAVPLPDIQLYGGQLADGTAVDAVPPPYPGGDGDGHPGVTVPVTVGLIHVDVYTGLAVTTRSTGVTLTDATTMAGSMTFATHGTVFGSSNTSLVAAGSQLDVTTTNPSVPYTATRLDADGSHDCAYVAGL